jgi:hypothetical protein
MYWLVPYAARSRRLLVLPISVGRLLTESTERARAGEAIVVTLPPAAVKDTPGASTGSANGRR